jgi:hypothetical protein
MKLGDAVRDVVSGYTGILAGRSEYLFGESAVLIVPLHKGDRFDDGHWFSESRVRAIDGTDEGTVQ